MNFLQNSMPAHARSMNNIQSSRSSIESVLRRSEQKSSFDDALDNAIGKNSASVAQSKEPVDKQLMKVCTEMESIFVGRMLKEMRDTVHKEGFIDGGFAEEIFEDMLYDQYALKLSETSNLGLAKSLYDELK
jgi:peptidoglycan hydrolase FlgJ